MRGTFKGYAKGSGHVHDLNQTYGPIRTRNLDYVSKANGVCGSLPPTGCSMPAEERAREDGGFLG